MKIHLLLIVFLFTGSILFSLYGSPSLDSIEAYRIGMDFYKKRQYDSAAFHFEIVSNVCQKAKKWEDYASVVTSLGRSFSRTGKQEVALTHYKKAIDAFEEAGFKNENVSRIYGYTGNIFMRQLSYEKALPFHEKAVQIAKETGDNESLVLRCTDLVNCLNFLERYREAIQRYLEVKNLITEEEFAQAILYMTISEAYFSLEEYVNAYTLNANAAKIAAKIERTPDHPRKRFVPYIRATLYSSIAKIEEQNKSWRMAIYHHEDALKNATKYFGPTNREIARRYVDLGNLYRKETPYQNRTLALNYFQQALIQVVPGFTDTSYSAYPNIEDFYPEPFIMTGLIGKAETFAEMYDSTRPETSGFLVQALEAFELGFASIRSLRNEYQEDVSKEYLSGYTYPMYEKAIRVCWDLWKAKGDRQYLEKAFALSDASKSVTLWQALQNKKAQVGRIPDSLLQRETLLKESLSKHKQELRNAISSEDDPAISSSRDSVIYFQRKLEILVEKLETNFNIYHQLKYAETPVAPGEVQSALEENTTLVEYFWGDRNLFLFVLDKDSFQVIQKEMPDQATQWIREYRRVLTDFTLVEDSAEKADRMYLSHARNLYNFLLKEVLDNSDKKHEKLVIVPDGPLGYIPFGTLLKRDTEKLSRTAPFVGIEHAIRYEYASRFLLKHKAEKAIARWAYGAFSPIYDGTFLADLPISRNGTEELTKVFSGKRWTGEEATQKAFFGHSHEFQILHLAMHAFADDEEPLDSHFVFSSGEKGKLDSLFVENLYTLDLAADLVVLSACETGMGELKRGEGIISLSRGFAYAGSPSLLVSLWSLHDAPTAEISGSFLQEIKSEKTKSEALQAARISYLENGGQPHPYYWAGLILVGENDELELVRSWGWIWWGLGLIFILILFAIMVRPFSKVSQKTSPPAR